MLHSIFKFYRHLENRPWSEYQVWNTKSSTEVISLQRLKDGSPPPACSKLDLHVQDCYHAGHKSPLKWLRTCQQTLFQFHLSEAVVAVKYDRSHPNWHQSIQFSGVTNTLVLTHLIKNNCRREKANNIVCAESKMH